MKKNFLGAICMILASVFFLSGCDKKISMTPNDEGFYDKEHDIQYVPCAELAIRPVYEVGEKDEYATDGETIYYKIQFEKPENFVCDKKDGVSFVYRNSKLDDITIENFNPIAAHIYLGDTTYLSTFYCEQKYLPDDLKDENAPDDSELVYAIRDALKYGESVYVSNENLSSENVYYFRLLSNNYPGLYYSVVFYTDNKGEAYLQDRGTRKSVLCPENIKKRMVN
jgi:hypothetical protein